MRISDAGSRGVALHRWHSVWYRVATLIWLNGNIAELADLPDPSGLSFMRADRAGRVRRHNGLARTYADLAHEAGQKVWTEALIFPDFPASMSARARRGVQSGAQRRMDVVTIPSISEPDWDGH